MSGLDDLAEAFYRSEKEMVEGLFELVSEGVKEGKQRSKKMVRASGFVARHAPRYPRSITSEAHSTGTGAWGEWGPEIQGGRNQGQLGAVAEYGGNHTGPKPHIGPVLRGLDREVERKGEKLIERVLW